MVSNSMLHAMIANENRKEYALYFLAHFLNRNYEEVYKTLELVRTENDNELHDMMIQNNMINEAKKIGKKMGIDERNLEIAKSMLKDGMDKKIISKYTGLSLEIIGELSS